MDRHEMTDGPAGLAVDWISDTHPESRLRMSLVDHCNYACFFCHNEGTLPTTLRDEPLMSAADFGLLASVAAEIGIHSIKLTGGEPLTYRRSGEDVVDVVRSVREAAPSADISLTTNAQLLSRMAGELRSAGTNRVTVSIHTLDEERFRRKISASGSVVAQLRGVRAAHEVGLDPIKANIVMYAGVDGNVNEIPQLIRQLRAVGVREVRLYQVLWSPTLPLKPESYQVPWTHVAHAITSAIGTPTSYERVRLELTKLDTPRRSGRASVRFKAEDGFAVVLDAMPPQAARPGNQEGDYAIRCSATGELRSHLFAPSEANVLPAIKRGDREQVHNALVRASSALKESILCD